jgi:hypothetical protein
MSSRLTLYCQGIIDAGCLFAVILTPLFFNVHSARVFEPDKVALLRALTGCVLAAWLVKAVSLRGAPLSRRAPSSALPRPRPLLLPVGVLATAAVVATLFSVSPLESVLGSYYRQQGLLTTVCYLTVFAAAASTGRSRTQVERFLTAVVATALPVSLYAIVQRLGWDPLPWGAPVAGRVTSTMGNPIFLGAYLSMAALVAQGKTVAAWRAVREGDHTRRASDYASLAASAAVLITTVVAVGLTLSRGPLFGLCAGLFFFWLLTALVEQRRTLAVGTIATALATAGVLVALNITAVPVGDRGRGFGFTVSHLVDTGTGTEQVRRAILSSVAQLLVSTSPLEYADGELDRWHTLRPLVGYGPETLAVTLRRRYPPSDALPDRAHSAVFDTLATQGMLGAGSHLAVVVILLALGLHHLGLLSTRGRRTVSALLVGATVATSIVTALWLGVPLVGLAARLGLIGGMVLVLVVLAGRLVLGQRVAPTDRHGTRPQWRTDLTVIALLSSVLVFLAETSVGIEIASTGVHFWLFAGLIVALAVHHNPGAPQATGGATPNVPAPPGADRANAAGDTIPTRPATVGWHASLTGALLTTVTLLPLVYVFGTHAATRTAMPPAEAATRLASDQAWVIAALLGGTWLIGGGLLQLDAARTLRGRQLAASVAVGLGLSAGAAALSWITVTTQTQNLLAVQSNGLVSLPGSATRLTWLFTGFGLQNLALLVLFPWPACRHAPGASSDRDGVGSHAGIVGRATAAVGLVAALVLAAMALRPVEADMLLQLGRRLEDQGGRLPAIVIYERVTRMAPYEDHHLFILGRAYLAAATEVAEPDRRDTLLEAAVVRLRRARTLRPLQGDHTSALARVYRYWADATTNFVTRLERGALAGAYYERATTLSPRDPQLWTEWAELTLRTFGNPEAARARLDRALALGGPTAEREALGRELERR